MRHGLIIAIAVLTLGLTADQARAGGVVIDFRELGLFAEQEHERVADGLLAEGLSDEPRVGKSVRGKQGGSSVPGYGSATHDSGEAPNPSISAQKAEIERQLELQRLIEAGVITQDEALVGCGATTAAGPIGVVPLAIAAVAILGLRGRRGARSQD